MNRLYAEQGEAEAALEAKYPNRTPDTDWKTIGEEILTERGMPAILPNDPTSRVQPQIADDYYGTYNPDELAVKADKNAEAIAYDTHGNIGDVYEKYRQLLYDLSKAEQWDEFWDVKAQQDAELAEWEAKWGLTKEQMLEDPSAMVYGRPTSAASVPLNEQSIAAPTDEEVAEETADILAEKAATTKSDGKGGGKGTQWADSEGKTAAQYWDEYQALGDDYEAKRKFLLGNPEFASYYREKYGEDGEVMWWEKDYAADASSRSYSTWRGGGGGWSSSGSSNYYDKPDYIDRGTPRQSYMYPIKPWEPSRYPMEIAKYKPSQKRNNAAQIRAMLGARRNYQYLR